ncbi:MAG: hypothetical protein H6923_10765 [Alphaproteobacteria bacterium]|nr:hypothetical protein [Alphaproteobacteria bacterium]
MSEQMDVFEAVAVDGTREELERLEKEFSELQGAAVLQHLLQEIAVLREALRRHERDLEVARAALKMRDLILPSLDAPELEAMFPERFEVLADAPVPGDQGFYPLEHDSKGLPMRWTGPGADFSFAIYVDRSRPLTVRLNILSSVAAENLKSISCFAEGPIRLQTGGRGVGVTFEGTLPAREFPGKTVLSFRVARVVSPSELDPSSTDIRPLGVAFHRLEVAPAAGAPALATPAGKKSRH